MLQKRGMLTVLCVVGALAPQGAFADNPAPDWSQLTTVGPTARIAPYMDYDSSRGRTVLFGGAESVNVYDRDTWEFDGAAWTRVATSGPPAGALGAMAYDSSRSVSVLFGGGDFNSTLPTQTWEWNGSTWTARFIPQAPPARVWQGMTYDSTRHVVVLFGGSASGGPKFNDTWEYDGTYWRQVVTAHAPSPRYGLGLAFDPTRNRTVLFGGWTDTGRAGDTWEYDGTDWTQVAPPTSPAPRWAHSMAYDGDLGGTVVFGGDYLLGSSFGPNNETWLYDGTTWTQLATGSSPSPRDNAAVAYDSTRTQLVLFGGTSEGMPQQPLGDTWQLGIPRPVAALSASSIAFPLEPVMSTTSRAVTLTNTGTAPLAVTSVSADGDFGAADDCPRSPATLGAGASCEITVTFTPSLGTVINGTLTVEDNAGGGVQSISLSGSGQWGQLSIVPSEVDFGAAPLGASFPTVRETVRVPDFPTLISFFAADVPFVARNVDCPIGTLMAVGSTCSVDVGMAPTVAGSFSGHLYVGGNMSLHQLVRLTGTATPLPATIAIQVTPFNTVEPTYLHSILVVATTNATYGTATFVLNGVQSAPPVQIDGAHRATAIIPLDDSTIPLGAGTYIVAVSVHPLDGLTTDNSATQSVTVVPGTASLTWNGSGLVVAGSTAQLSAVVTQPQFETQVDYAHDPVWVRFDVTDGAGAVTTFYGRVAATSGPAIAGATTAPLAAGAYSVRARLVDGSGSSLPNSFLRAEDLRTNFAAQPVRGGFIVGVSQTPATSVSFEFTAGSAGSGALECVQATLVLGADGKLHDAYLMIASTSFASVRSRSHTATATGDATVMVVDAASGARYSAFDQTTTFQLTIATDGSVTVTAGSFNATLPPGSGINHL